MTEFERLLEEEKIWAAQQERKKVKMEFAKKLLERGFDELAVMEFTELMLVEIKEISAELSLETS